METSADPVTDELIEIMLEGVSDPNLRGLLAGLVRNGQINDACLLKNLHIPSTTMTVWSDGNKR